jgi:homoserine dehydrogenase
MQQVNLGMIGGGTVGSGVFHALQLNGRLMASRIGVNVQVRKIAVKAFDEPRPYPIPAALMTTDWQTVVNDPEIHMVSELVGGTNLARTIILAALKLGKPVITANKALLSAHGEELFEAAQQYGTNLYYEASVCGGIPIIKSLREGFVGNRITHLYGIVNGTCNYILTRMKLEGGDFQEILKDAQAQGYAEAEPSLDVDGHDALHKIGILASLAHGFWVNPQAYSRRRHPPDHEDGHSICQPAWLYDQTAGYYQTHRGLRAKSEDQKSKIKNPGFGLSDPGSEFTCPGKC